MQLVQTFRLTSPQASIEFINIPQDADILIFEMQAIDDQGGLVPKPLNLTLNRSRGYLVFDTSFSASSTANWDLFAVNPTEHAGTSFVRFIIGNYANTIGTGNTKPLLTQHRKGNIALIKRGMVEGGGWIDGAALTSMVFSTYDGTNIEAGNVFSLYKLSMN